MGFQLISDLVFRFIAPKNGYYLKPGVHKVARGGGNFSHPCLKPYNMLIRVGSFGQFYNINWGLG